MNSPKHSSNNPSERDPELERRLELSGRFGYPDKEAPPRPRGRWTLPISIAVIAMLVLIGFMRNSPGGRGISATKIGPLRIGEATVADAHLRFGLELAGWRKNKEGAPVAFKGELWRYDCPGMTESIFGTSCRTLFGFQKGRLQSVLTNNPQLATHAGTRIGSTVAQALKRDHGTWTGWKAKCPGVSFPSPKGTVFMARVFRNAANPDGIISGFYLSTVPGSFGPCGD